MPLHTHRFQEDVVDKLPNIILADFYGAIRIA